jgi:glycosyltransferase involved in cell wall biosynthesis
VNRPNLPGNADQSKSPETSRPTLGVVAIAYNEERDLGAFLEHLLPWVDEIVIVDDGSTDQTATLAREAGEKVTVNVSPRQPSEYYSHQRNKGIAAATSDWLLHMDIDERVPPELATEICDAIQDPAMAGYRFRRLNFFLHHPMRGGGWQKWNLVHLARRDKFRFGGKMHETCLVDAPHECIGQLQHRIWHLNDTDYSERLRKSFAYCQVDAEDLAKRTIGWWHILLKPLIAFVKTYFLQCGFRDGIRGLISSCHAADARFRACALAWDAQHPTSRHELEAQLGALWKKAGAEPDRPLPLQAVTSSARS